VLDTTAPTAVASIVSLSADTGIGTDFITSTAAQTISGTYTNAIGAGETLRVSLDNGETWVDASTAAEGNWTLADATITSNTLQAAVFDTAGNASAAATQVVTLDTTPPTFLSAASSIDGTKVILTYDEALNATTAAAGAFVLTIGGVANVVTSVAVSGSTVELTLTTAVADGDTVTVAYTDPAVGDDANAIQDAIGLDAITISVQTVTNNVPDTTAPAAHATTPIAVNETNGTTANIYDIGDKITITFDEAVSTTDLLIGSLAVNNTHNLGTGASITAVTPLNGFATSFDIVLGDGTTVAPNDVITATAANVVDAAGNAPSGDVGFTAPGFIDTSIVVFDLVNGVSSDHSSRTFDATLEYTIFVVVNAMSQILNKIPTTGATWGSWDGASSLGVDDTVVLMSSDGASVQGYFGHEASSSEMVSGMVLAWGVEAAYDSAAAVWNDGILFRNFGHRQSYEDLWVGTATFGVQTSAHIQQGYNPAGLGDVLTTQGLT
jgi:uncharacterized repeat protein (TIGR02059 family)